MNHQGTIKLETERLILRRFSIEDTHEYFVNCLSRDKVMKYTGKKIYNDEFDVEGLLYTLEAAYINPKIYNWAIVSKDTNKVIGNINAANISDHNERCEIDYKLCDDLWNLGYMTEVLSSVISFLFKTVGFHKIEGYHFADNKSSGRVMQKCGMLYEGCKKEHLKGADGKFYDVIYYGIINK